MLGESPMRPKALLVMPPVDVPAAIVPFLSIATAPTVPNFESVLSKSSDKETSFLFAWRSQQTRLFERKQNHP
jgi:hypothetical protein